MSQPDAPFPGPPAPTVTDDRGFYRSPQRVAVLALIAPLGYELWWLWQLFQFSRREQFPNARSFWWLLLPFYNIYVLYQVFDDLKQALAAPSSSITFSAGAATWLIVLSLTIGNASARFNGLLGLGLFIVSGVSLAIAAYLVQQAANGYQDRHHGGRTLMAMTVGEWAATVIGVVVFLLLIMASFLPA